MSVLQLPPIDLKKFRDRLPGWQDECVEAVRRFRVYGVIVLFVGDLMPAGLDQHALKTFAEFFGRPVWDKVRYRHREIGHQRGWTPPFEEVAKARETVMALPPDAQPYEMHPNGDLKERWFHAVDCPYDADYNALSLPNDVPDVPGWLEACDGWAAFMNAAMMTLVEMVEIGLRLPEGAIRELMQNGPHLVAPTGVDLALFRNARYAWAGVHDDLNFLTGHGKSNFPGLYVWTKDGERISVVVPDGCILVQAGQQLEYLTAGEILCGLHEVVPPHDPGIIDAFLKKCRLGGLPGVRTTTTGFWHLAVRSTMQPVGHLASLPGAEKYPPILAGEYVLNELRRIGLLQ